MGNVCCEEENKNNTEGRDGFGVVRKVYNSPADPTPADPHGKRQSKTTPGAKLVESQSPSNSQMNSSTQSGFIKHGPENYQSIKYLGKGTFGDVVLAEDKETGKQYAMKIIEKKKIKEANVLQSEVIKKISQCDLFVRIR